MNDTPSKFPHQFVDGTCLKCQSVTYGCSSGYAPEGVPGDPKTADYYIWCSNEECPHHIGEAVGDMECPPEWASHDKAE